MIDIASAPERDLKNIRQIGTPLEGERIYMENAAYARVHEENYEQRRVFVFMGHTECSAGVYTTFVEAAIPVRDMEFSQNLPRFGVHAWSDIFREIKRSYEKSIIVGWALDCKGFPPRMTAELEAIHREQFGGAHQVLFLMDSMEGEESFYILGGNRLKQLGGFYIYYAHELYEIPTPGAVPELPKRGSVRSLPEADEAVKNRCMESVQKQESSQHSRKAGSYAVAAAAALLLLLIGAGVWQGKLSLSSLRDAVETLGGSIGAADTQAPEAGTEALAVTDTETVSEPLTLIPIEEIPAGEVKKETAEETGTEAAAETESPAEDDTEEASATETYYIVQKGDTLTGICIAHYGSAERLDELEEANDLENSDDIRVGQKLLLP